MSWPFMSKHFKGPPKRISEMDRMVHKSTAGQIMGALKSNEKLAEDERDRIVLELDTRAAKAIFPMMSDDAVLPMLHKCRYEMPKMPDKLRHESRDYLEGEGMGRLRNLPWPPKGQFPAEPPKPIK